MYGVILWSDPDVRKAVIWCEDHGELAYYEAPAHYSARDGLFFDPGDYVQFELSIDNNLRRASNATTIQAASFPYVAHTLEASAGAENQNAFYADHHDNVIPLASRRDVTLKRGSDLSHHG